MHFGITTEHTSVLFPARLKFGAWSHELFATLTRARESYPNSRALIVCSPSQLERAQSAIRCNQLEGVSCEVFRSCDPDTVVKLDTISAASSIDILIAFGGGSVIDLCKLVAQRRNCVLVVVPSVLSSDCVASPVAVLRRGGASVSCPGAMPSEIIVDTSIIGAAPRRFLVAGVGDLLSNASALSEVDRLSIGKTNDFAILLAEASIAGFVPLVHSQNPSTGKVIEGLSKGLILSAMAMAFAGNSSPCSGSEHLISHAIDTMGSSALHGEQVGLATLYVSALREMLGLSGLSIEVTRALRVYCGFEDPSDFGINRTAFINAVQAADKVRPGRAPFWSRLDLRRDQLEVAYDLAFKAPTSAVIPGTEVAFA